MEHKIEVEMEQDGRFVAEIVDNPKLNGVMTYGETREEAIEKVEQLAARVTAGRQA